MFQCLLAPPPPPSPLVVAPPLLPQDAPPHPGGVCWPMAAGSATAVRALLIADRPATSAPGGTLVDEFDFLSENWYEEQLCIRRWKGVEWDEAYNAPGVAKCLASKAYQAVVVVDIGEAKAFEKKCLPDLVLYARSGGSVAFPTTHGAAAASVVAEFFGLSWKAMPGGPRRVCLAPCGQPGRLAVQKHLGVPASEVDGGACVYSARVECIQTPAADACLGPADGSGGAAVAVAACGEGRVAFFGDVSGERATALLVEGFVRAGGETAGPMTAQELAQIIEKNHAGRTLYKAESYDAALEVFKAGLEVLAGKAGGPKAWECNAEKVKVLATMAECHHRRERFTECIDCATQALELDPSSYKSRMRRAHALLSLGNRKDEVVKDLAHVIREGSSAAHAAQMMLEKLKASMPERTNESARANVETANAMTAEVLAAVISRKDAGNKLFQANSYKAALEAYKAAMAIIAAKVGGPKAKECAAEQVKVLSNMAECFLRLQDYNSCIAHATGALDVDASHSKSRLRRAKACIGNGNQRDDAMEDLAHVIKDGGSAAHEAESILARLKADVTEEVNARAQGSKLMTAQVLAQTIAKKDAGNAQFQQQSYDAALVQYSEALEVLAGKSGGPKTKECAAEKVKVLANMAECYLRLQKYTKCVVCASDALNVDASHSKSRLRRAKARIALDSQLDAAMQDLTQVVKEGGSPAYEAEIILGRLRASLNTVGSGPAGPMSAEVLARVVEMKEAGNAWFQEKQYRGALAQYDEALETIVDRVGGPHAKECEAERLKLLSSVAECYLRIGDYVECVGAATEALKLDASGTKNRVRRVEALMTLGRFEDEQLLKDCVLLGEEGGWAKAELRRIMEPVAQESAAQDAVYTGPMTAQLLEYMLERKEQGNALFAAGRYNSAMAPYQEARNAALGKSGGPKAKECEAEMVKVVSNTAECYLRLQEYGKCFAYATEALDRDETHSKSRLRKAKALIALGTQSDDAVKDLVQVIKDGGGTKNEAERLLAGLRVDIAARKPKQSKRPSS